GKGLEIQFAIEKEKKAYHVLVYRVHGYKRVMDQAERQSFYLERAFLEVTAAVAELFRSRDLDMAIMAKYTMERAEAQQELMARQANQHAAEAEKMVKTQEALQKQNEESGLNLTVSQDFSDLAVKAREKEAEALEERERLLGIFNRTKETHARALARVNLTTAEMEMYLAEQTDDLARTSVRDVRFAVKAAENRLRAREVAFEQAVEKTAVARGEGFVRAELEIRFPAKSVAEFFGVPESTNATSGTGAGAAAAASAGAAPVPAATTPTAATTAALLQRDESFLPTAGMLQSKGAAMLQLAQAGSSAPEAVADAVLHDLRPQDYDDLINYLNDQQDNAGSSSTVGATAPSSVPRGHSAEMLFLQVGTESTSYADMKQEQETRKQQELAKATASGNKKATVVDELEAILEDKRDRAHISLLQVRDLRGLAVATADAEEGDVTDPDGAQPQREP
ncbi:unnamed protein product, partial [Amoebophrya sp. A120]